MAAQASQQPDAAVRVAEYPEPNYEDEKPRNEAVAERIAKFREKYNHETFVAHLKEKLAAGFQFDFDARKIIDGTMTEDDWRQYERICKKGWTKAAAERA